MSGVGNGAGDSGDIEALSPEQRRALLAELLRKRQAQRREQPASFAQLRLWFLDQLLADSASYVITVALRLEGPLDRTALRRGLDEIVARHEVLRTTFAARGGEPVQIVAAAAPVQLDSADLSAVAADVRGAELQRVARSLRAERFDLARGPLLRACLVRLGDREHALLLAIHHIAYDGWSNDIVMQELAALYDAFRAGRASPLTPLRIQYGEFASWQRGWLTGAVLAGLIDHWRKALANLPVLDLATDFPRPPVQRFDSARQSLVVPEDTVLRLDALSRECGATLFMTVLAALGVLLRRYSGQDDIVVGSPVAGRGRAETEAMIGCFINTVVLRTDLSGDPTFRELVSRVRERCLDAFEHSDLPFEKLVEALQPERDMSRNPLFQVLFVLQGGRAVATTAQRAQGDVSIGQLELDSGTTRLDLEFYAYRARDGMRVLINYRTDLFERGTIDRMLRHFVALLTDVARDAQRPISKVSLLDADERKLVLETWNAQSAELPREPSVHARFIAQAARTPEAIALVCGDERVTYVELGARAAQLAHHLIERGVGRGDLVGIHLERGLPLVVALLGILEAGAAYVPLDPKYPRDRLAYMIEHSGLALLVTTQELARKLEQSRVKTLCIDVDGERISAQRREPPVVDVEPDDLAYVIYTSGSTGRPKGVEIRHRSALNLVSAMARELDVTAADVLLSVTTLSFDIAVFDLLVPLTVGAQVVVAESELAADGAALAARLAASGATVMQATPPTWRLLVGAGWNGDGKLRALLGGEAFGLDLARPLLERCGGLWNGYGPTETTVYSAVRRITIDDPRVCIGGPLANTELYVLDEHRAPAPIGVPGELYIGGVGLARGYRNQPELTAERFVEHPFATTPGAKLYRTGDRVRFRADGDIEYLGRLDHQVKLRGFRIELGEIETVLGQMRGVRSAVVVVREDRPGDRRLVAYVVPAADAAPTAAEVRAHARESLPEYMVPGIVVRIDTLPLTPSGKVDRKALPAPESTRRDLDTEFEAPSGPVEELLANLWSAVLGVAHVGAQDNFFELGGHSLLATQIASRIRDAFEIEFPLAEIFTTPTLAAFARRIETMRAGSDAKAAPPLVRTARSGELPLSFQQQRLWFFHQLEPTSFAYNMPNARRLRGPLDHAALRQSLQTIVERHESLRASFPNVGGEPRVVIAPALEVVLPIEDLGALPAAQREDAARARVRAEAKSPFRLDTGPLLRASLLRLDEGDHVLLLTVHHIVSDGWSLDVLSRELVTLYAAYREGRPSPLPPLAVQYADYARWQRAWLAGDVLEAEIGHWKRKLGHSPAVLELPTDHPRPRVPRHVGGGVSASVSRETTRQLKKVGDEENATLFMTLLAAFQVLLMRASGQREILVGTPISGRNRTEVEGLIGFFINTLVIRGDLSGKPTFRELLRRVRVAALEAYAHQEVPFERLVDELVPERDLSRNPLFQVFCNMIDVTESGRVRWPDIEVESAGSFEEPAKFDLTLYLVKRADDVSFRINYDAELFDATSIEAMARQYCTLLDEIAANANRPIHALPVLSRDERVSVRGRHNADVVTQPFVTFAAADAQQSIGARFEQIVSRGPDRVALAMRGVSWSYADLSAMANRVTAAITRTLGDADPQRVALLFSIGGPALGTVLGVLRSGHAYVPLDPVYPEAWLASVLEDTRAAALVTTREHESLARALAGARPVLVFEELDPAPQFVAKPVSADALAFIRYTSGSTGRPKGVMQSHHGLLEHIRAYTNSLHIASDDRLSLVSSYTFDGGLMDVYSALLNGATLCPLAVRELTPEQFAAAIEERGITIYHSTPSVFRYLASGLAPTHVFERVRLVVFGGEEARPTDVATFQRHFPRGSWLVNGLGATETSQGLHAFIGHDAPCTRQRVPVGYPIVGSEVVLLDEDGEETEVFGEIGVVSDHVALGYWGRPEETAAKFSKFADDPADARRLYRTGDLGRRLADGQIEWLARKDQQVKIRGYRIEPGEIASALHEHAAVKEAVAVARPGPDHEPRLVAYVVARDGQVVDVDALRAFLAGRLPEYMMPSAIVTQDAMPRTPGGKVDRKALPEPDLARAAPSSEYVEPRSNVEARVAAIYAEVLGIQRVGATDHFFERGGHSLLATRVISRVNAAFAIDLALLAIFESPRVADLARRIDAACDGTSTAARATPIERAPPGEPKQLSFGQHRFWFLEQLQPGTAAYHLHVALRLEGVLDVAALRRAIVAVAERHEVLRCGYPVGADGEPRVVVADSFAISGGDIDLSAQPEVARAAELARLATAEVQTPFALAQGPPLRARVIRLGEREHVLLLTVHHIAADAWSMGILLRELGALYEAFHSGRASPLVPLQLQYADFAYQQRKRLSGERLDEEVRYWKDRLVGAPPLLDLPTDRPRPAVETFAGARVAHSFAASLTSRLETLSQRSGATLFMTLLAGFECLLARYCRQTDIVIGTPVAGRTRAEYEDLVGLFVNSLVLRTDLSGDPTFEELIARVRAVSLGAFAHQELPFERLVAELKPPRNLSHHPLFQVMLVLQNAPRELSPLAELTMRPLLTERTSAQIDLTLFAWQSGSRIHVQAEYKSDLFDASTIERMLEQFERLLESAVESPTRRLSELSLLGDAERARVLSAWNPSSTAFESAATVHALFERQVLATPDAVAILFEGTSWTYRELDERATRLARRLHARGIGRGSLVALALDRGLDLVASLLGILKSGAAYLPLDPGHPRERSSFILGDAGACAIVTHAGRAASLVAPDAGIAVFDVNDATDAVATDEPVPSGASADDLAYVIYTSGSTGRPKGVEIEHRSVVNFLTAMRDQPGITASDVVVSVTTISFDIAVLEILLPLTVGARVVLASAAVASDGVRLAALLVESKATLMQATPTTWKMLLEARWVGDRRLKLLCGGEAWSRALADPLLARCGSLWNMYGPTESTVWSAATRVEKGTTPVAIGIPIANTAFHVLDDAGRLTPIGVPGELYIGGAGLARGYRNRPELTAERFVRSPFDASGAARLYRTGDLVRRRTDGTLEFMGRLDHQVKLRGFRIELGEIEAVLAEHEHVREVVAVVREVKPGDARLLAYVVAREHATITAHELQSFVRRRLPEYMTPSRVALLAALPLTPNGKIDRNALPLPTDARGDESATSVAPMPVGPVEELLASVWSAVLGVEHVASGDGFFALGGHSLLATQLTSRIRDAFGIELALAEIFTIPTLGALARRIEELLRGASAPALPALAPARANDAPLSFQQQRLWFLDQLEQGSAAYNMTLARRLRGALDVDALRRALQSIVDRHDSLRMTFPATDGTPRVAIAPALVVEAPIVDLSASDPARRDADLREAIETEAARAFCLARGPLLRATILRVETLDHVLLLSLHHIVSDATSLAILWEELATAYAAECDGKPAPLPTLPVQYGDFARWQRGWLVDDALELELAHWVRQLDGCPRVLDLPTDHPRPRVMRTRGASVLAKVPAPVAAALRALASDENATLFMTLVAAFEVVLMRHSGQREFLIGTPISGRTRTEVEGLIGFFINTLVLRADLTGAPTFRELLRRVRANALNAYPHQELPFEKLVDALQPERDQSRNPLFQVFVNMIEAAQERTSTLRALTVEPVGHVEEASKFDLTLYLFPRRDGLVLRLNYDAELFDASTMDAMLHHYGTLLATIAADPDLPLPRLRFVTHDARAALRARHHADRVEHPFEVFGADDARLSIGARFERVARRAPQHVAIRASDTAWTYGEVLELSDRVAAAIASRIDDAHAQRVALIFSPGGPMASGSFGVLRAGHAYVPLDPAYPEAWLRFVLEDTRAAAIVTTERHAALARSLARERAVLVVEELPAAPQFVAKPVSADALAFIRYTSGSTGRPKGVMQSHHGLLEHIRAYTNSLHIASDDRLSLVSSYTFDGGLMDVYSALLNGATLCPLAVRELTPEQFAAAIEERGITIYHSTPSVFRYLASGLAPTHVFERVRLVVFGGEEARPTDVATFQRHFPRGSWLVNGLGATETSQGLHAFIGHDAPCTRQRVPVGYPIVGSEVVLLDEDGEETEVFGEIGVVSDHVALGYWGRPEETAAKFSKFADDPADARRLYRTGDLGRRLADGQIEWLARKDQQVKIRGHRIELGEIGAVLRERRDVADAAIVAWPTDAGDQRLVAYVVPHAGAQLDHGALRADLGARLPEYMLPSAFVTLERVPKTPSGKIDRAALPQPTDDASGVGDRSATPTSSVEERLAVIFADVLHVDAVGAHDDFFARGGHSLLATQVVSRIRDVFDVELPLLDLFEQPTVAKLAARVDVRRRERAARSGAEAIPRLVADAPRVLSFGQQRFWFLEQMQPGTAALNMHFALRVLGDLDVAALARALAEIVRRHEVLRSAYPEGADGEPRVAISDGASIALAVTDLSELTAEAREAELARLATAEARQPFDIARGPLLRVALLRVAATEHAMLTTMHHMVSDAWSVSNYVRELGALYAVYAVNAPSPLAELPVQYADFASWQRQRLDDEHVESALAYWKRQLAGAPPLLELPTDRPRPAAESFRGARLSHSFGTALSRELTALSRRSGVTLFMTLLAGFKALLARYSRQTDIVVGTPVAGRTRTEIEDLIGLFVNSLVLRTDLGGDPTFDDLIARVRDVSFGAYAHQEVPFELVVRALRPPRNLSHHPLFQVMLVLQNAPRNGARLPGLELRPQLSDRTTSQFDLTVFAWEAGSQVHLRAEYKSDLFDASTIERMLEQFERLLESAVESPTRRLSELSLLGDAERARVLSAWNPSSTAFESAATVHALFERQVLATPDAVAILFEGTSWTYRELDERATRLARRLHARGIGRGSLVALALDRGLDLVASLLGILKSGAAYLPLDPGHPRERSSFILGDAGACAIVTHAGRAASLVAPDAGIAVFDVNDATDAVATDEPVPSGASADDLAYVIYTSGSTGRPKGVEIEHRSVVNFLTAMRDQPGITASDVVVSVTTISFDIAVLEILLPLTVGARVVLASAAVASDGVRLAALLVESKATLMQATPTTWKMLLEARWVGDRRLKLLCGGEAWSRALADPLLARCGSLWNMYGPTESTVWSAATRVEKGTTPVAIGIPIANTAFHVLDDAGRLTPIGVPGELYIGGAGLARGYRNRPELTAERFVRSPFDASGAARLYRTGDLVRRRTDGTLEFMGRLDHQVKVSGFRIELGEIEAVLARQRGIREVVAAVREFGPDDARLVAYLVIEGSPAHADAELQATLRGLLPHYMVPSAFVVLDALPRTPNGKIDRAALPAPTRSRSESVPRDATPQTPIEQQLAAIWRELLGVDRVSVQDNFFDLGGHSLLAMRVVARLESAIGVRILPGELIVQTLGQVAASAAASMRITAPASDALAAEPISSTKPKPRWFERVRDLLRGRARP